MVRDLIYVFYLQALCGGILVSTKFLFIYYFFKKKSCSLHKSWKMKAGFSKFFLPRTFHLKFDVIAVLEWFVEMFFYS